jgi:hypothetical protein
MTTTATAAEVAPVAMAGRALRHELRAVRVVWYRDLELVHKPGAPVGQNGPVRSCSVARARR